MKAWQGSLGISKHLGITSPDYAVYTPTHDEDAGFLHHMFRSRDKPGLYLRISTGVRPSQWRLELDKFEQLYFFFPPKSEQKEIASFINMNLQRLADLGDKCQQQISLFQERRTALISAAVTGKIDVRNHPSAQDPARDSATSSTIQAA